MKVVYITKNFGGAAKGIVSLNVKPFARLIFLITSYRFRFIWVQKSFR